MHEHIIGLLYHSDYTELVTLTGLEQHVEDQKEFNRSLRADPLLRDQKCLYAKEYTLRQYADGRRGTDLTRFNFCPECGAKIDWKAIRQQAPRPP